MKFLYPDVLFFILIPTFILFYFIVTKKSTLEKYFSKDALSKLQINNNYFTKKTRNIILLFSLILMIISLARPVINKKELELNQELTSLIIAIDVSKSMLSNDIYPNRLEFAKNKLLQIIDLSPDFSIGVILFAKSSFLISPLTQDLNSLKILVKRFDTGLNFDNGTNIYSSLELTKKLLKNYENKNLLLLTDGGEKENFKEEINFAKKNNIDIYTLGIASKNGGAIKLKNGNYQTDEKGNIVNVKLNKNIKKLSLNTNGGFINYSLNEDDIKNILKDIRVQAKKNNFKQKKHTTYTELFYYPLALSILLLLLGFYSLPSKNKILINLILFNFFIFYPSKTQADIFDFTKIKEANKAYKAKDYSLAKRSYNEINSNSEEKNYNIANSLYKDKKYKEAIKKYKSIDTEDINLNHKKFHNLGNSYVKSNNLQEAIKSYEQALKFKNDKETKENLELIKKHIKDKQNKQNQDNNKKQKNKDDKKSKKEKNNKEKEENKNKKENKKDSNPKEKKEKKDNKTQKYNQKDISDKEEKKWLKKLENKQTGTLIKKFKSSKEDDVKNPW